MLLAVSVLWGGWPTAQVGAQDVAAPRSRHIMWKVQSSENIIYILGLVTLNVTWGSGA